MNLSRFSIIFGGLLGVLFLTTWVSSTEIGERCFYLENCYSICRTEDYVAYSTSPYPHPPTCKCPCRNTIQYPKETKTFSTHCSESHTCSSICRTTYGSGWSGLACNKPSSTIGVVIDVKSDQNQDEKNFGGRTCTCFCRDYLKEMGF